VPLPGAREGDRVALAVISLALDEVDAAHMPRQRRRREREWQPRPDGGRTRTRASSPKQAPA
jgi:hypothetical protein